MTVTDMLRDGDGAKVGLGRAMLIVWGVDCFVCAEKASF